MSVQFTQSSQSLTHPASKQPACNTAEMSDAPSSLPPSDATTVGTTMEGVEVKVLEMFASTGSVGSFVNTLPNARAFTPTTPPPGRPPGGPRLTQIRPERASCEALRGALWHDQIGIAAPELMVISASGAG
jgi:hypothetical protein